MVAPQLHSSPAPQLRGTFYISTGDGLLTGPDNSTRSAAKQRSKAPSNNFGLGGGA